MDSHLTPTSSHVLVRKACPLHYWLTGPLTAPLLVLTHGATADQGMFAHQVRALSDHYRVLTWDMRGHGLSQPMGTAFTVAESVNDLLAILAEIGSEQAIFAGHSTGGYVTQELVFRYPEKAQALVMIDCICITLPVSWRDQLLLRLTPALLWMYPYSLLVRQSVNASTVTQEGYDYLEAAMNRIPKKEMVTILAAVTKAIHPEPQYQITHPLLLVHGDEDNLGTIKKDAPRWTERDPNCTYRVIPDAGHLAHMDNPAFFNRLLLEFLDSLQGGF